jgi:hypothetical protein
VSVPAPFAYAHAVDIEAPLDAVWTYAGDSGRATEWSVYFDHIAPLPESPVPDGAVGALRRCYRRADQRGVTWDEEVTAVELHRFRAIRTYALRGFHPLVQPAAGRTEYRVAQHYEALRPERTRLTFSTALAQPDVAPARWLFARTASDVVRIFRLNLENLQAAVETAHQGEAYVRPHAYEPAHPMD